MAVKVGTFAKTTSAAPVSQAVTDVGFKPRAIIFWTAGKTATGGLSGSWQAAIGFAARNAADTLTVGSVGVAYEDGVATNPNVAGRSQVKALTLVDYDQNTIAECDLSSMDDAGFTLNWTTNDASAYLIHYMALGGEDLTDAYVLSWAVDTSTGNKSKTGVGFEHDCVLHLMGDATTLGTNVNKSGISLGVMTTSAQWVQHARATETNGQDRAWGRSLYCMGGFGTSTAPDGETEYVSMDADGFTVNVVDAWAEAKRAFSLCLKGGSYYAGSRTRGLGSAPYDESVTSVGLLPEGVLFSGNGLDATSLNTSVSSFQIGATDGTAQADVLMNSDAGEDPSDGDAFSKTDKVLSIGYGSSSAPGISREAAIKTLDADGYTLTWTTTAESGGLYYLLAFDLGAAAAATAKARNQVIWL